MLTMRLAVGSAPREAGDKLNSISTYHCGSARDERPRHTREGARYLQALSDQDCSWCELCPMAQQFVEFILLLLVAPRDTVGK